MMYGDGDGGWGWGAWLGMSLTMLALAGLIVWAVMSVRGRPSGDADNARRTPEDVLADRLAAGEIDGVEYRERLDALHGRPTTPPAPQ